MENDGESQNSNQILLIDAYRYLKLCPCLGVSNVFL